MWIYLTSGNTNLPLQAILVAFVQVDQQAQAHLTLKCHYWGAMLVVRCFLYTSLLKSFPLLCEIFISVNKWLFCRLLLAQCCNLRGGGLMTSETHFALPNKCTYAHYCYLWTGQWSYKVAQYSSIWYGDRVTFTQADYSFEKWKTFSERKKSCSDKKWGYIQNWCYNYFFESLHGANSNFKCLSAILAQLQVRVKAKLNLPLLMKPGNLWAQRLSRLPLE